MSNSTDFLKAYSAIENYLRKHAPANDKRLPFNQLVSDAARKDSVVRNKEVDLKEYGELRNAIVHDRTDEPVIAEPTDRAVSGIQKIEKLILTPPKVFPMFKRTVLTLQASDSIANAVKQMLSHDFSQIPVRKDSVFSGLLTANAITRWLGSHAEDDIFSLRETEIGKVLKSAEERNDYFFLGTTSTVVDALLQFNRFEENGHRLEAALITHSGEKTQEIIGIITIADLPKAIKAIS